MGEISDLVGVYGAVDTTVEDNGDRRAPVARIVPLYEHEDVHWFRDFDAWTRGRRAAEVEEPPFPDLPEALEHLARTPARGRMRARRLMAIAAAAHAIPDVGDPETELGSLAARALGVEGLVDDAARGDELLRRLADPALLPADDDERDLDDWWGELLASGLIDDPDSMGPRPCSGELIVVEVMGQAVPVTILTTSFEVDLDFDRAVAFLNPENWPHCNDFWCEMTPVPTPGVNRFHEKVSTDCADQQLAWTIEAELDFAFTHEPDFGSAEYRMSPGVAQPDVLVDEGSLIVRQVEPGRLAVVTTKRILFDGPLSGRALAMVMCVIGYAYVAEDLVFTCAMGGGEGIPLPQDEGVGTHQGAVPDCGPIITALADDAAAAITACLEDWADAARASSKQIADGQYTADALVQDVAGLLSRTLRHGAAAIDVGARSARQTAVTRRQGGPSAAP
jgi:hypothetical protein